MSIPPESGSGSGIVVQAPINVPLPTYELQYTRSIVALIDCICQLAHHALIGDGSDGAVESEVQMVKLSYGRSFSRSVETRVSHTYWRSAIHTIPLSLELLQCVLAKPSMQYRSPINLESKHTGIPHCVRIAHASTHLGMTIVLPESLSAEVV